MTAALYIDKNGHYPNLRVDCWDAARDARKFDGPGPVIAHPPCGPWGRLAHFCTKQDADLAVRAVEQVRAFGGVLEHPAGSRLWTHCGLPPASDDIPLFPTRDWSLRVDQCRWGHRARKSTWLFFSGVDPRRVPPIPPWIEPTAVIDTNSRHKGKGTGQPHVPKSQRHITPLAFAAWLTQALEGK